MCCYHYFIRNLGNQYIYIYVGCFFQYIFLFTNDQNQQIEYSTKSLHTYLHMSCIRAIYCKTYHQRPVAMVFAEKWLPTPGNQREQELRKLKDKKNIRERLRKNKKLAEADRILLKNANAWVDDSAQPPETAPKLEEGHADKTIMVIFQYLIPLCIFMGMCMMNLV